MFGFLYDGEGRLRLFSGVAGYWVEVEVEEIDFRGIIDNDRADYCEIF